MNLLQIGTSLGPNGIANVMKGIAGVWQGKIFFGVLKSDDCSCDEITWIPPKLLSKRKCIKYFPYFLTHLLKKICIKNKVDAILLHYAPLDEIGYRVARSLSIKVYYYYHNVTDPSFYQGEEKERRIQEDRHMLSLIKRVDGVFCNSQFTSDKVLKETGRQACVAKPGVDVNFFQPIQFKKNQSVLKLVYVGRGVEHKGLKDLLEAVVDILNENSQVSFDYVGHLSQDEYGQACEQLLDHPQIRWWKNSSNQELLSVLQHGDVFVSGSQFEGFGMPFIEAASCGLPSVAFDCTAISEAVVNGKTGELVTPGDWDSFKAVIRSWLEDPKKIELYKKKAREHALKHTWETMSHKIRERIQS